MKTTKQLSVFLENLHERLASVTRLLGDNGINLRGLTIADAEDFGILRLLVSEPERTLRVLHSHNLAAKVTDVLSVEIEDRPGALATVLDCLQEGDVSIEYLYVTHSDCKPLVVLKVEHLDRGAHLLRSAGYNLVVAVDEQATTADDGQSQEREE